MVCRKPSTYWYVWYKTNSIKQNGIGTEVMWSIYVKRVEETLDESALQAWSHGETTILPQNWSRRNAMIRGNIRDFVSSNFGATDERPILLKTVDDRYSDGESYFDDNDAKFLNWRV